MGNTRIPAVAPPTARRPDKTRREFLKRAYLPPTIIALGQPIHTLGSPPPPPGAAPSFFDPRFEPLRDPGQ